ncbi:UDP-N-acetylmuramoylalanine--D-glutamate ligase, partial [hydrothermal vent metagenome]
VRWAKEERIAVFGEIEFGYQFCPCPVIAITGSNGKTTTVTLLKEILTVAGFRVSLCGNCGIPFSGSVLDFSNNDYVILEVSSFQLESLLSRKDIAQTFLSEIKDDFKPFTPCIAAVLNVSINHLDRHADFSEYVQAKKKIFLNQDSSNYAFVRESDAKEFNMVDGVTAQVHFLDQDLSVDENPNYRAVKNIISVLDIDPLIADSVINHFQGVEHRLEWIRCLDGIDYVNDSKATTAESCVWALKNIRQPVILICGGRDKNIDFSVVNSYIKENLKKIFAIGEAREKIKQTFKNFLQVEMCEDLEEAVVKARENAVQGDCVLLSPMCASFDMFLDFEDRGTQYKQIVKMLG